MKNKKSLLEILREKGYRLTPQRMMVLEAIEASHDHISAEEIHARTRLQYPYINISTVYRTLELLKENGLVTETDLGGGRFLYHPAGKAQHHHLVCRKCAKVRDIDINVLDNLRDQLKAQYGFDAELEHIAIFGTCDRCEG
ncbi:MAG: transcriptional repressor [Dehalococcoidia bacterium]|nr:MAG: transcriptional repressor [Dehalococcoidia bacterium]